MKKKYIILEDAMALLERLLDGKRVQGVLYFDENTRSVTFKPYYTRSQHKRDKLIRKLEHGWVKESATRIKKYVSIDKELGTARVMTIMDREDREAKDALIERELDLIEFC